MLKLSVLLISIAIISNSTTANLSIQIPDKSLRIEETNTENLNVVVLPFSYYQGHENLNQNPFKQFERDVMRNFQNNYKKRAIKFYTEEQAKSENITAHQFLKISLDHYNEGMPIDNQTTQEFSKQLGSGTNTSVVRATVTTTTRTITATGVLNMVITDSSGKNLFTDNFAVENVIVKQWSKATGDSRALDNPYGMMRDPGIITQLEPFLKKTSYELDNRFRKFINEFGK